MLQRASKQTPCPLCGAIRRCATDVESNRFFCYNVSKSTAPFTFLSKKGVFSIFRNTNLKGQPSLSGSRTKSVIQESKPQFEYSIKYSTSLRQEDILRVFSQLKLTENHLEELLSRKLTKSQIEQINPVSVDFKTKIEHATGAAPGFDKNGIWAMGRAMLVPVYNLVKEIDGYQLKNDNAEYGKYIWAKCYEEKTQNLVRNDSKVTTRLGRELPLQHHIINEEDTLYLTEGILKPLVAGYRHNINILGASGGLFTSSPYTFKQTLLSLKPKKVIWLADSGSALNEHVVGRIMDTAKFLFVETGLDLKIADWNQLEDKDNKLDCDEVDTIEIETANLLSSRYFHVNIKGEELFAETAKVIANVLNQPEVFGSGVNQITNNIYGTFDGTLPSVGFNNQVTGGLYFEPEQRQEILSLAYQRGFHYVLDVSQTGASKSHYSGELETSKFVHPDGQASKIWYFHARHREPSTTTLDKNFTEHPTKNTILYHSGKKTPHFGKPVLVRDKPKNFIGSELGNCANANQQAELYQAGVEISMCKKCPYFDNCLKGEDPGVFGYRYQVQKALMNDRIRANYYGLNPQSIAADDIAVIDEYSQTLQFVDTIDVSVADWDSSQRLLGEILKDSYGILKPLEDILRGKRQISQFGINFDELMTVVPENKWNSLIGYANLAAELEERDSQILASTGSAPKLLWIEKLFRALSGQDKHSSLTIKKGRISILSRNVGTLEKLSSFRTVVFMDATATKASLSKELGCAESDILLISCKPKDVSNVTIKQIPSLGTPNKGRRKGQLEKIKMLRDWCKAKHGDKVGFIDWKIYCEKGDLAHFVDGRGSNVFEKKEAIMSFGAANTNLCAARATFECIEGGKLGNQLNYKDFDAYYEKLRQAETEQEIGRLRASRRDEPLVYYTVSSNNLFYLQERGYSYEVLRGFEIDPRICNTKETIIYAALKLKKQGKLSKTSLSKLAQSSGLSYKTASLFAKGFKGGYQKFVDNVIKGVYERPELLLESLRQKHESEDDLLGVLDVIGSLKHQLKGFKIIEDEHGDKQYFDIVVKST